jgi:hypothetical protein
MAGGGGAIGEESHNGFSINEWCESRGGKVESFTWQISGELSAEEMAASKYAPIIMEFDAEQKKLWVNLNFANKFGVDVEIVPLDPKFDETNKRNRSLI